MELEKYLEVLFDPDDGICIADSPKGTRVQTLSMAYTRKFPHYTFICINPLDALRDRKPTESYHSQFEARRADHNVTEFRNILVEMDKMPLEEQQIYMVGIDFPYSTLLYSGNKSYHYIISLETPAPTRREYDKLVSRIYRAVGNNLVDQTCRNPSRFTRMPGHFRQDTKKEQSLMHVSGRISTEILESWLLKRGAPPIEDNPWEDITYRPSRKRDISSLFPSTRNFLMQGTTENWNHALFKAAADLCRNGWNLEGAREELIKITGHLDIADEKTIKSAFSNEENKNGQKD